MLNYKLIKWTELFNTLSHKSLMKVKKNTSVCFVIPFPFYASLYFNVRCWNLIKILYKKRSDESCIVCALYFCSWFCEAPCANQLTTARMQYYTTQDIHPDSLLLWKKISKANSLSSNGMKTFRGKKAGELLCIH